MALNYTYLKYKDTYTLKNNGGVPLTYSVSKVTCEATTEIKTGTILPGQTTVLNFIVDGNYSVYLASSTEVGMPFIIKYYNNLLLSFISMVEGIICGCSKCNDCEECNQCEDYLGTFMKAQAFAAVNSPTYQGYINQITQDSICVFTEEVLCNLLHEKVYGNADVKEVMLKLIGFYYLSFYYQDKFLAIDAQEKIYITEKYKFDKIGACMRKLGILPTDPLFMTTTTTVAPITTLAPTTSTSTSTSTTTTSNSTTSTTTTTLPITSTSTTTTTPITSSTTTTLPVCFIAGTAVYNIVEPCQLAGIAIEIVPTTSTTTSTTTLAPTTSTTTTIVPTSTSTSTTTPTTTVAPTTSTTTVPTTTTSTTTTVPVSNCLCYTLYWSPPLTGMFVGITNFQYLDCDGITQSASASDFASVDVCAQVGSIVIISGGDQTGGWDLSEINCCAPATTTTMTPLPGLINLSQLSSGCPASVSSYPYTVTVDDLPIHVGSILTGGLPPSNSGGSSYYYTNPYFGIQFDSSGVVTAVNDCLILVE